MKTYKLGNKIKCIIRSYSTGMIGKQYMQHPNQPYTVLKDVEASLTFDEKNRKASTTYNVLSYVSDYLKEINISNVELNDKILNLIFSDREENLCSTFENHTILNQEFQLDIDVKDIYQVFIYDVDGNLITTADHVHLPEGSASYLYLENPVFKDYDRNKYMEYNDDILIFFSYEGESGYCLNNEISPYLSLDLILEGNQDDEFLTSYIHIEKCVLRINKNMRFNHSINSIDLIFNVVDEKDNYITLG